MRMPFNVVGVKCGLRVFTHNFIGSGFMASSGWVQLGSMTVYLNILCNSPQNATRVEEREVPHGPGLIFRLTDFDLEALRDGLGSFMPCVDVLDQQMHLVVGSVFLNKEIL